MARYDISEKPQSLNVVWEQDGTKWELSWDGLWYSPEAVNVGKDWSQLLYDYGPVFDVRPVSVGEEISIDCFMEMPDGSVSASDSEAYILRDGRTYATGYNMVVLPGRVSKEDTVTVLRVGTGAEE